MRVFESLESEVVGEHTVIMAFRRFGPRRNVDGWHHLAGSVAAALIDELFAKSWIRRRQDKRQLLVIERGRQGLANTFAITTDHETVATIELQAGRPRRT